MDKNTYSLTVAAIFAVIAVVHALRLYFGWEGVIGGWMVPTWLSWLAVLVAGFLAYQGFFLSRKS